MMNGEGTSETVSLNDKLSNWKIPNPKLLDNNYKNNDESPISSPYSSCGESEFDRYCSANSVMGTASLCGSVGTFHDFPDSDIGSMKSLKFGDVNGLENFSLGGKFENKTLLNLGEYSKRPEQKMNLYDEMENSFSDLSDGGGVIKWKDDIKFKKNQNLSNNESLNTETVVSVDEVNDVFESGKQLDEHSEVETSSRLEHSESEGSMYGYGTDNEKSNVLLHKNYTGYSHDLNNENEKTFFMNSSVAYGADDWNDFMQETSQTPQDLFVTDHKFQDHDQNDASQSQKQESVKEFFINNQMDVVHDLSTNLNHEGEEREQIRKDLSVIGKQAENFNQLKIEEVSQVERAPLMDTKSNGTLENLKVDLGRSTLTQDLEDHNPYSLQSLPNIKLEKRQNVTPNSLNIPGGVQKESKAENYELNEFYDEVVFEMEEILLDSGESPAARFTRGRKHHNSHVSLPSRDGSSTSSTSSINNFPLVDQNPHKIDHIEVIGAKQKKGDVSLGERLVGVKEYTVYKLRISSGTHDWVVERRYRDFFTLYRRLKTSFANKGWELPSVWSKVDQESRKYFGNSNPDVVQERSVLIQECLQSILNSKFSSNLPNSMIWFLSPPKNQTFNTKIDNSQIGNNSSKPIYALGQSISLIVEIRAHKSMRQMLEQQHYTCAGCHKYFDEGKTRLWEFVQTFGWGKPRVCEYSGQVFCSNCHVNETAILPARVLHLWDFTEYPVSQLAKSYLDSIHDKPMLCVSAVNPFLFSKVPPLQHVINVRKRIGRMLPFVRCPFRRSIYKGVGSRRYFLESSDFFALKDLVDLSKGVFSALPVMVETISKKIVNHITDECLICYDVGVPCGARQACHDPSSLIFPFQEGEVERCKSCELVYHKPCLKKMVSCPCGVDFGPKSNVGPNEMHVGPGPNRESKSSMGFLSLSGLLSKASYWGSKEKDTVIPMGSLPSSSL